MYMYVYVCIHIYIYIYIHIYIRFLRQILDFPKYHLIYIHIPFIPLHKYRSVHEHHRLFRTPPLLGPPRSLPEFRIKGLESHIQIHIVLCVKP